MLQFLLGVVQPRALGQRLVHQHAEEHEVQAIQLSARAVIRRVCDSSRRLGFALALAFALAAAAPSLARPHRSQLALHLCGGRGPLLDRAVRIQGLRKQQVPPRPPEMTAGT
jgi:hypothetical protein